MTLVALFPIFPLVTEQERLYEKDNPMKFEQIQYKISEAGSKVKDEQNAKMKKIGIG